MITSAQQQFERASKLWPGINLPKPPATFSPQTKSEVLLLHVPDTFDALWDRVEAPKGYSKQRSPHIRESGLELAPGKRAYERPVWLAFDPEHGRNKSPVSFQKLTTIAASEVLSALIQFPKWPLTWFKGSSAPNLAGYRVKESSSWSEIPYLDRWDEGDSYDPQLEMTSLRSGHKHATWASPSVRVC